MFKFIVLGAIILLLLFLLAEPAMQAGKRVAKRFKGISDDLES